MPVPVVDEIHFKKKKKDDKRSLSKKEDDVKEALHLEPPRSSSNPPANNIIPVGAPAIKVPTTLGLVGPNNNPFIANEIVVNPQKKNKKKKAITKTALKNNPNTLNEVDKDGNVIKARRNALNENEEIEKNVLDQDQMEKICDLCQRPRPIFVVDTDDMIKRLPERFLSPLLKSLKKDFNNKR